MAPPRAYSVRFAQVQGPTATRVFQVPAAHRAVVRGVSFLNGSGTSARVWLAIAGVYVWVRAFQAVYIGGFEELRLVAYEGESITLATEGSDVSAHVAGFLFTAAGVGAYATQQPYEAAVPRPAWPPAESAVIEHRAD